MADMEELAKVSVAIDDSPLTECQDHVALHDQECRRVPWCSQWRDEEAEWQDVWIVGSHGV